MHFSIATFWFLSNVSEPNGQTRISPVYTQQGEKKKKSVFKRAVAAEREELKQVITSGEKAVNTEVISEAVEQHGRRRGSHCTAAVE